jgi:hypothetical protein
MGLMKGVLVFTLAASAATLAATLTVGRVEAQPVCLGDCNGDGSVTVDEIIIMVNIALGEADVEDCAAGDGDASGNVTVDEIVTAVNNALNGCPPVGGALGTRHFVLDPARSNFTAVLAPGFEINLGAFRGQTDGVVGDAFFDFEAGEPDESGLAAINVTASSEYIFANASIANITLCVKPLVPVSNAGVVQCNGGLDYSIQTGIDHVAGRIGENDFTFNDCTALGGVLEGPNQVCAVGLVGEECFLNSDCDTTFGSADGMCGLTTGRCPAGQLSAGAPCNTNEDCGGETCTPVTCTEGKEGETCRNAGDCDTAPGADDGICGTPDPHPGACNGPLSFGQVGEDSGPGSAVFAPLSGLQGLPVELGIEQAPPCGDEGAAVAQPFAMTTGTALTMIGNFSGGATDLIFDQSGENLSCSNWANGTGGRFVLSFPTIHLNPMNGGDLVIGLAFQGR